ncbi:MAG TPA: hypothetical protein VHA57_04155 [Actinomycetota bacterium]|nr:hypothetical protein [Actinomycetota bacterium]
MRRGSSTVLSLIGEVHREVLAPLNAAPNVSVVRPRGEEPDAVERAFAEAAGRAAPFVVVSGDLLHDVAVEWRNRWDVRSGRDDFEVKAGEALGRWRSGRLELPDYYLVALDEHPVAPGEPARPGATHPHDLYLAVFRTERPQPGTPARGRGRPRRPDSGDPGGTAAGSLVARARTGLSRPRGPSTRQRSRRRGSHANQ